MRISGCESLLRRLREALADLGAEFVDRGELVAALDVPVGPAVAGFQPLRQRAGAVDRDNLRPKLHGAVRAHERRHLALRIGELLARLDHAALDQRGEWHPWG